MRKRRKKKNSVRRPKLNCKKRERNLTDQEQLLSWLGTHILVYPPSSLGFQLPWTAYEYLLHAHTHTHTHERDLLHTLQKKDWEFLLLTPKFFVGTSVSQPLEYSIACRHFQTRRTSWKKLLLLLLLHPPAKWPE